ncbi:AraC family ligand binding domain-containing protein [Paenibacillus lautus]|uniref:cupin domain-containing protein n=1 Tax=Paenibacillus lautus TaxID=1401 RepID=UPI002DB661E0|nr:cupin domain-containing protein [Paenibacillus lautus]MEC0207233.1 AraC family ligand binding domain-containing protein [Paenibacillus lautus]
MRYLYEFIERQDDMPFKLFVNSVKHVPFHWPKEVEIVYVLQGSVILHLDQKEYTLHQDDVVVVNSMSIHTFARMKSLKNLSVEFMSDALTCKKR